MFIFVTKHALLNVNSSSRQSFLRIKDPILLRNLYSHTVSGNGKNVLFKNFNMQRITKFKCTSKKNEKNDSILSSYLSLFIRRSRIDAKDALKSHPELEKVKINPNGIRRLISLAKPEKYKIAFGMFLLVISSTVTMSVPFGIGKLIDFIQSGDRETMQDNLKKITLIMSVVFLLGALANFGRVYIIQSTGQRIVMRLRKQLFTSIMNQEMAFFDRNKTGELINRLSSDAEVVGQSISQNLSDGLRSIMQAIGGVSMMMYVSPTLGIIGLSVVPPVSIKR
jgi:ATP-binding cassette subfamily B (MDR/TAP) protein 10